MSRTSASPASNLATVLCVLLALPLGASAADFTLKFEPGLAAPLGSPQSDRFKLGIGGSAKGLAGFEGGWVNLSLGLTFLALPAKEGFASDTTGIAWAPGIGLRIQSPRESDRLRLEQPHQAETLWGAKPWLDAEFLYVRTGDLDRAGLSLALGLSFPIGVTRLWRIGPFVRYFQILQSDRDGIDGGDAKVLIFGVSLEGAARFVTKQDPEPCPVCGDNKPVKAAKALERPDRDKDGVPDDDDVCPDVQGFPDNRGCPKYEKLIVQADKLELTEKIQFEVGTGVIDVVSHPLLNDVVQALQDNKNMRVAIEGHASSEGADERNQTLSEQRGQAVLEYLAKKGVARDRLVAHGFSSSRPIETNTTEAGREANRRVEFVVHFIILKDAQ